MTEPMTPTFEVGQRWRYRTRPGETDSTLQIVRIRVLPTGRRIFSIGVDRIRLQNSSDRGFQDCLPHAPVDEPSLRSSVSALVESNLDEPATFAPAHDLWAEAFDHGQAGVFNIPVADVLQVIEDAWRHGQSLG